jgi:hypothetical protein
VVAISWLNLQEIGMQKGIEKNGSKNTKGKKFFLRRKLSSHHHDTPSSQGDDKNNSINPDQVSCYPVHQPPISFIALFYRPIKDISRIQRWYNFPGSTFIPQANSLGTFENQWLQVWFILFASMKGVTQISANAASSDSMFLLILNSSQHKCSISRSQGLECNP